MPNDLRIIMLRVTREEHEQVKLAASLKHQSMATYIKVAINRSMQKEGVDSVLFREPGD